MGYGYGSVYQRKSDGLWCAVVELPRQRGEKRRRHIVTSTAREVVEAKLDAYRMEHPAEEYGGRAEHLERTRREHGRHTAGEWWALVRRVGRRCTYCGRLTNVFTLAQDHDVPLSRGGTDLIDNIVVSCRSCNIEKGAMTGDEYRAWKAAG